MQVVQDVMALLHAPFTTPLNAVQIFLIVGLILVASIFWTRILAHLSA